MQWRFLDAPTPLALAHQGGTDAAPGNTVAAFDHAYSLGYRYFETDVRVSSDGVLVVFHDDDTGPTTGETGTIEDRTWAQLQELRIGDGHRIARFDDLVERFDDVRWNIDPKDDSAVGPLVEAIGSNDLQDRVCVGSFSDRRLNEIGKRVGPALCRSPGPRGVALVLLAAIVGWRRWEPPYGCLQIPARYGFVPLAMPWLIRRVQRLGLQVHLWTINDRVEMIELLDRGADGIITDEVTLLRDVLRERGAWQGAAEG